MNKLPPILYHGSPRKLDSLNPRDEHGDPRVKAAVFASPDRKFALAYAGNKWGDRDIEQRTQGSPDNNKMTLYEMRPGAFKEIYGTSGYLYELPSKGFKPLKGRRASSEVVSHGQVSPSRVDKIRNVLSALRKSPDVELRKYDAGSPEMLSSVRRQLKRMKAMSPKDEEGYKRWRLEVAPPEIKAMFAREEASLEKKAEALPSSRYLSSRATHAHERRTQRTRLGPGVIKAIEAKLRTMKLPPGDKYVSIPGEGYAAIKQVGNRNIVATFLSSSMIPRGSEVVLSKPTLDGFKKQAGTGMAEVGKEKKKHPIRRGLAYGALTGAGAALLRPAKTTGSGKKRFLLDKVTDGAAGTFRKIRRDAVGDSRTMHRIKQLHRFVKHPGREMALRFPSHLTRAFGSVAG